MSAPPRVPIAAYCTLVAIIAFVAFKRPLPSFDRVLYSAAVASLETSDQARIHDIAIDSMKGEPSFNPGADKVAAAFTAGTMSEQDALAEQAPLYRVKFGYVALAYALWKAGVPLAAALRIISVLSFVGLALIILLWTRSPWSATLLILVPPILNTSRTVTADPLSALVIVAGLFFLSRGKNALGACLIVASALIRADNAVLAWVLAGFLIMRGSRKTAGWLFVGGGLAGFTVSRWAGFNSWQTLMYHSFVQPLVHLAPHTLSASQYLRAETRGAEMLVYSFLPAFAVMGWMAWRMTRSYLPPACLIAIAVRMLAFPNGEDRYFVWAYVVCACMMLALLPRLWRAGPVRAAEEWLPVEQFHDRRRNQSTPESVIIDSLYTPY